MSLEEGWILPNPSLHLIVSTHPYFFLLHSSFCQLCIVPIFSSHSLLFLQLTMLMAVPDQYMNLSFMPNLLFIPHPR